VCLNLLQRIDSQDREALCPSPYTQSLHGAAWTRLMMKNDQGQLLFSPSDLTEFMESEFASWMSRLRIEHPGRIAPKEKEEGSSGSIKGIALGECAGGILSPDDLQERAEQHLTEIRAGEIYIRFGMYNSATPRRDKNGHLYSHDIRQPGSVHPCW
jgi:hypothetical protein